MALLKKIRRSIGDFLHRHILKRWASAIRLDETRLDAILQKAKEGPIVYVTFNLGRLEAVVLNDLFLDYNLAHAATLYSLREWDPDYFDLIDQQFLTSLRKPATIIPVQLIWDKRPKKEKASVFEALFGESEHPSLLRKIILFFRHYKKRGVVRFGEPIPLSGESDPKSLYQKIVQSFLIERRALTGTAIHPRSWFLEKIFEEEGLNRTIYEVAKEKNKPVDSVKHLALKYAKEITADLRHSYIEFTAAILNKIFKHLFEGIILDTEGIKTLKKTLSKGPVILVPNHRSHLDYLLMGYLCYHHDIVSPYVAAGINMAFFPMGRFFRRCGAFFLRRSFEGNQLYKKVFQSYLKILVREGYAQEFFIEGGRSRSGKLRTPRLGMLSMYSDCMAQGAAKDIHFLPISITYDKVLEEKSYLAEEAGKPKTQERARDLLKMTKYLKGRYGKIYVHFGEPISWQETAAEAAEPEWEKKKSKLVPMLADRICHAINQHIVTTPTALAALALLLHPKEGILAEEAEQNFLRLLHYIRFKEVKLSAPLMQNPARALQEALLQFESAGLIKKHKGLERPFYEIPKEKRRQLDFFKNFSIHRFVSLSLFCKLLLSHQNGPIPLDKIAKEYSLFQDFLRYEFRFSTRRPLTDHLETMCRFLSDVKIIDYRSGEIALIKEGLAALNDFSLIIQNYLEGYWVTWETFLLKPTQPWNEKELVQVTLQHAKELYLLGKIRYPEAISKTILENAIQALKIFQETKQLKTTLDRLIAL